MKNPWKCPHVLIYPQEIGTLNRILTENTAGTEDHCHY